MRAEPLYTPQEYTRLFQQGDERGLVFYFHEFHAALAFYANQWVESRTIAEEIASDAFVNTWKMHWKLDTYKGIRAYLYKTVRRAATKANQRERKRTETHQKSRPADITFETPFDHLVRSEAVRIIHSALKTLPKGSRMVLTMHYLEGKSTNEIAAELNLAPGTVQTQKTRGLEALRKKLLRPMILLFSLATLFFPPLY